MVTSARSGELDRMSVSAPPCPRCSRSPKTSRPPRSAALAFCACDPPGFLFIAFVVLVPASSRGRWQYTNRGRVLATKHHQEKEKTTPFVRPERPETIHTNTTRRTPSSGKKIRPRICYMLLQRHPR